MIALAVKLAVWLPPKLLSVWLGGLKMRIAEARQAAPEPRRPASEAQRKEHPVAVAGRQLARYGLVVVIAWIGAL